MTLGLGIWQVVIVQVLILLFAVGISIAAIAVSKNANPVSRVEYGLWVAALIGVWALIVTIDYSTAAAFAVTIMSLVFGMMFVVKTAARFVYAGKSRWMAVLLFLPLINAIVIAVGCILAPKNQAITNRHDA